MGKPFAQELVSLQATYDFCLRLPIESLEQFVGRVLCLPLVAIGSGGSFTAAHFTCLLHQQTGRLARPVTPFEFNSISLACQGAAVLFHSAGGANPDILTTFQKATIQEVRELGILCTKKESPLATLARHTGAATVFETDLPSGKDGFLATNSLLATLVLITRAYGAEIGNLQSLRENLPSGVTSTISAINKWIGLSRRTLMILHGGWSSPVAWDIESKFTEAALGNVQLADYRNFGHGRHHWLAKRGYETAIIALVTPEEAKIANRTLNLLPEEVTTLQLRTDYSGPAATIALLMQAFALVQSAGEHLGIDPGKPEVPMFGRNLYHLKYRVELPPIGPSLRADTREGSAIYRKTSLNPHPLSGYDEARWRQAYHAYLTSLAMARFGAIVFDYDDTLCDRADRLRGLSDVITKEMKYLLMKGLLIGVATGRGKSVGQALRNAFPAMLHCQIFVGYYNCAHIHPLTEEIDASAYQQPEGKLHDLARLFEADSSLHSLATLTIRNRQITLEARPRVCRERLFDWVIQRIIHEPSVENALVRSTRSVDILAPGVTKRALVDFLERSLHNSPGPDVLCIGDQGRWPGNDYALLAHRYSLSVDEVSDASDTCWNLSPPGCRGVPVTLAYLRALSLDDGYAHFDPAHISLEDGVESESGT